MEEMAEDLIKEVEKKVKKAGKIYYYFSHIIFDCEHKFTRADKFFLSTLYYDGQDVIYRRMSPLIKKSENKHKIEFSRNSIFRIMSRDRKGFVVEQKDIGPKEKFRITGLYKKMKTGKKSCYISFDRKGDVQLLPILENIFFSKEKDIKEVFPKMFLTVPRNKPTPPFLRDCPKSINWLSEQKGYDKFKNVRSNLKDMRNNLTIDAGMGREAWPYEYFRGNGVVALDVQHLYQWFSADQINIDEDHLRIE